MATAEHEQSTKAESTPKSMTV
ncbi:MAG: hypothetical protein RIS70_1859, partial [Planctomycetota bacterium]